LDETLAATNLANIFIGAGAHQQAEKLLKEAQGKKEVHENVNESLVSLDKTRKKDRETRTENLELAKRQHDFFVGYADALASADTSLSVLDGVWLDSKGKVVELKDDQSDHTVEINWTEEKPQPIYFGPTEDKLKFIGKRNGLVVNGEITKFEQTMATLLTKPEGAFAAGGKGYLYFNGVSELRLLRQGVGRDCRILTFRRAS
jgi:hypothetical protein